MSTFNYFDWLGFAKYIQNTFKSPVAPYGKDGKYWKGWEHLRGKRIKEKDIQRWIQDDNFAGFGIIIGKSKTPVAIGPSVEQLQEVDPFILAFSKLTVELLHKGTDWKGLVQDIDEMRKMYGKSK